jgi:hypothetical protein
MVRVNVGDGYILQLLLLYPQQPGRFQNNRNGTGRPGFHQHPAVIPPNKISRSPSHQTAILQVKQEHIPVQLNYISQSSNTTIPISGTVLADDYCNNPTLLQYLKEFFLSK